MTEWISFPNPDAGLKSACGRFRLHITPNRPPPVPRWTLIDYEADGYGRCWPLVTTHPTLEDAQFYAERRVHHGNDI